MNNIKLPFKQSAGYIYCADGVLRGRIFHDTLLPYEVNNLADVTITALNTLIPGVDTYLQLSDAIIDLQVAVNNMDKETRDKLEPLLDKAHKAKKTLFIKSKLISKIHNLKKPS